MNWEKRVPRFFFWIGKIPTDYVASGHLIGKLNQFNQTHYILESLNSPRSWSACSVGQSRLLCGRCFSGHSTLFLWKRVAWRLQRTLVAYLSIVLFARSPVNCCNTLLTIRLKYSLIIYYLQKRYKKSRHKICKNKPCRSYRFTLTFYSSLKVWGGLPSEMRTTAREAVENMQHLNRDILEDEQSLLRALHESMVCLLLLLRKARRSMSYAYDRVVYCKSDETCQSSRKCTLNKKGIEI